MTTTRQPGEFGVGNHNEQILYLRGETRDRDLMVSVMLKPGVGGVIATVLNRHLEEFTQELVARTGSLRPGVSVKRLPGDPDE